VWDHYIVSRAASRIKDQHQERRNQPHYSFRVDRAEQLGEVERRAGFGGDVGTLSSAL
jgi:hypothetical protein